MADEKLAVDATDGTVAAVNLVLSLFAQLTIKGVLSADEANFVAASAASMCEAQDAPIAATLVRTAVPSSIDVNISVAAMKQGISIKREAK